MFAGSKFCPHCGTAVVVPKTGPNVPHLCPRCETENLQVVSLSGVQLEDCPHCGGLWIGVEVFDRICAQKEAAEAAIAVPLLPPVPVENHVRYLKCPQCAKLMNRYKFADRCGVVLDKCSLHGIWFDRDELRQVIEFIRAGGLDEARMREIETLRRQQDALELDRRLANVGTGGQGSYSLGDFQGSSHDNSMLGAFASFINAFLD